MSFLVFLSVYLLWLVNTSRIFATLPICTTTCAPNPGSSTYSSTISARGQPQNARGRGSNVTVAVIPADDVRVKSLPGSGSYSYAVPVLHLPGRNGLDLDLTLYYNSRFWTYTPSGKTVTFNADRDFPSYGFRLDFGYVELDSANSRHILTTANGNKHTLGNTGTNSYDSLDATYIHYCLASAENGVSCRYARHNGEDTCARNARTILQKRKSPFCAGI